MKPAIMKWLLALVIASLVLLPINIALVYVQTGVVFLLGLALAGLAGFAFSELRREIDRREKVDRILRTASERARAEP
jgi:hypothetical protein